MSNVNPTFLLPAVPVAESLDGDLQLLPPDPPVDGAKVAVAELRSEWELLPGDHPLVRLALDLPAPQEGFVRYRVGNQADTGYWYWGSLLANIKQLIIVE